MPNTDEGLEKLGILSILVGISIKYGALSNYHVDMSKHHRMTPRW